MRVKQMHRGEITSRKYTPRKATRMSHNCHGACSQPIRVGDFYWDHHGDIRYCRACFKVVQERSKELES
jgi:hypothetical protein